MHDVRYASPRFNGIELDIIYKSLKTLLQNVTSIEADHVIDLLVRVKTYIDLESLD